MLVRSDSACLLGIDLPKKTLTACAINADAVEFRARMAADLKESVGRTERGNITETGSATLRWTLCQAVTDRGEKPFHQPCTTRPLESDRPTATCDQLLDGHHFCYPFTSNGLSSFGKAACGRRTNTVKRWSVHNPLEKPCFRGASESLRVNRRGWLRVARNSFCLLSDTHGISSAQPETSETCSNFTQ
jgi:hypothetical protein